MCTLYQGPYNNYIGADHLHMYVSQPALNHHQQRLLEHYHEPNQLKQPVDHNNRDQL